LARSEGRMAADPPESSGRSKAVLTTRLKTGRTPSSMEKASCRSLDAKIQGLVRENLAWRNILAADKRLAWPAANSLGCSVGSEKASAPRTSLPNPQKIPGPQFKVGGQPQDATARSAVDAVFHPDQMVTQGKASLRGHHHLKRRRVAKTDGFPCQPSVGCRS